MATKATSKLAALNAAFKSITVGDLGEAILKPTAYNRFVRLLQEEANILRAARRVPMPTPITEIHRTGFLQRVLRAGDASDGTHKVLVQSEYAKPAFQVNKLQAFEVQGTVSIYDKTLRRNLEKSYYINTLLDGFNQAVGKDLEELFLFMNTAYNPATDLLLSKGNGWVKEGVNKIYGLTAGSGNGTTGNKARNFDPTSTDPDAGFPRNMFQALLLAIPKVHFRNPSEWVIYCSWEVQDAYREQIARRDGVAADSAIIDGKVHNFKGIRIEYAPGIQKSATTAAGGAGKVAMLQHPNNMAWGVFHEVTVEPSRWPEERRTAYVVTAEVDAGYEDENAVVIALIDQANPT